jgi:indole-3-glycerol phosphate synthase/phosphoribosylanthranilate isomerase
VFDTRIGQRSGGTGRTFDWSLISGRSDAASGFLAGGIGPANARAAQRVGTFGIDVGSAIEAAPGCKDRVSMDALFAALRPTCRGNTPCD